VKSQSEFVELVNLDNVGGYIDDSTRSEIDYAVKHGKKVRYLED